MSLLAGSVTACGALQLLHQGREQGILPSVFFFSRVLSPLVKISLGKESPKAHWGKVSGAIRLHWTWGEKRGPWSAQLPCRVLSELPSKQAVPRKATEKSHGLAGQAVPACQFAPKTAFLQGRENKPCVAKSFQSLRPMFSSFLFLLRMSPPSPFAVYCHLFSKVASGI